MFSLCQCSTIILQCIFILSELSYMYQAVCPSPTPIANTITEPPLLATYHVIGSYVIWTCDVGYVMSGDSDSVVWVCGENGNWMGHSPECSVVNCTGPAMPAFAILSDTLPASGIGVNETVTYQCNDGYGIIGPTSNQCQADGTWSLTTSPTCQRACGNKYRRHTNHTCYTKRKSRTWDAAFNKCQEKGEILATVTDADTQQFLKISVPELSNKDDFWIGAREGDDWKWTHSGTYIHRLFWSNIPSSGSGHCLLLNDDQPIFTWDHETCTTENAIICQHDSPCSGIGLQPNDTVLDFIGKCFQFIDGNMPWSEGVHVCMKRGGFLAEIPDESTNNLLTNRAAYLIDSEIVTGSRNWWIGGHDANIVDERSWFWPDNTRVVYTSWQPGQPGPNNECVEIDTNEDMDWNDKDCDDEKEQICQLGTQACGDPGKPLNGQRLPDDRTTFLVGATLQFSCNEGYNITGQDSILTCQTNGIWDMDKPLCKAVKCIGRPPSVENVKNFTISSSSYKGVSLYYCLEGYIPDYSPVSVCLHNGSWSAPNFTCVSLHACYSDPCYNGGSCTEKRNDEFHCACPPGFTGITCGTEIPTSTPVITDTQPTILSITSENEIDTSTPVIINTQPTIVSTTLGNAPPMSYIAVTAASVSGIVVVMMSIIICVVIGKRRRNKPSKAAGHSNEDQEHEYNVLQKPSQHVYKEIALDVGNNYELVEQRKRESWNEHTYDLLDMDMIDQTKGGSSTAKQASVRSKSQQREDIEKIDENFTSVPELDDEMMTTNELYYSSLKDKDTADDVTYPKLTVKAGSKIDKTTEDRAVGGGIGDLVDNDLYIPSVEPPNVTHTREKLESTEDGINSSPDNVTPSPIPTSGGVEGHDYEFDEDVAMVENELYSAASTYGKEEAGAADNSNKGSNIYVNDAYQAEASDNAADDDGIYNTID